MFGSREKFYIYVFLPFKDEVWVSFVGLMTQHSLDPHDWDSGTGR